MTMRLIGRLLDNWGTEVEKLTHGELPLTPLHEKNLRFPFQEVQRYTTQYIISKKERTVAGLCDERLIKLVQKHESKQIAFAACTHLLSPQAVRTLIIRDFAQLDPQLYLQLILIAYHGAPNAVEQLDSERAKEMLGRYKMWTAILGPDGLYLKSLFDIIRQGVPRTSLVYSALYTQVISVIPIVAAKMAQHRMRHQWHLAWHVICWLADVSSNEVHFPEDCLNPIELLDRNFRSWRMWAAWKPVESIAQQYSCDPEQRAKLHEFLALEGPDDQIPPRGNVCERILAQGLVIENKIARIGTTTSTWNITLKLEVGSQNEARELLRKLCRALGPGCQSGPLNVEIFIELYLDKEITSQSLDVIFANRLADKIIVSEELLRMYKSVREGTSEKLDAARAMLRQLPDPKCEKLRSSPAGQLAANIIVEEIQDLQAKLLISWEEDPTSTSTKELECTLSLLVGDVLRDSMAELRLSPLANDAFFDLMKHWPASRHLSNLQAMRQSLEKDGVTGPSVVRLQAKLTLYLRDLYVKRGTVDQDTRDMINVLASKFFKTSSSLERKYLVVFLADGPGKFRTTCISIMEFLPDATVTILVQIMREWLQPLLCEAACVKMARFLGSRLGLEREESIDEAWKPVLYRMLKAKGEQMILKAATWTPAQYIQFFGDLSAIFNGMIWNPKLSPSILNPSFQEWAAQLSPYLPVFEIMRSNPRWSGTVEFFMAVDEPWIIEGILCHLKLEDGWHRRNSMHEASYCITSLMSKDNAQEIYEVLCSISFMSSGGVATCVRLLDLCHDGKTAIASVLLAGWIQDSAWEEKDIRGFKDVAHLLCITPTDTVDITAEILEAVMAYMNSQYNEIVESAQRIEVRRVQLKAIDTVEVSQLLYDNEIEDTTAMEDAFARLPVELMNVVEQINDSEVEIIFPLTDLTPLHRAAMGIGNAQSLFLRLYVGDYGSQPKFCIHLDNEPKLDSHDVHSQWTVFTNGKPPELPICHGTITPATYQLARVLSRFLVKGSHDLHSIHTLVTRVLKTMGYECVICGTLHGTELRRATVCDGWECLHIFSQSPMEIRLGLILTDPLAVDLILTMIHNAITSGFHNLLPNCPFSHIQCLSILRSLPKMEVIQRSKSVWTSIKGWQDGKSEQFLTWAICSFRGFLSTASGNLRIPSLPPGTLQFILANAAPIKELSFASEFRTNAQQSRVMFHGTSLDRLYLIMHQGLKIMSGTPLQVYGAAYGNGIYLAEDPGISWAYAKTPKTKTNWTNSAIKNERVLLGCEMTAPESTPHDRGIHVIPTEASVMVRYIFVVPSETVKMPINGHVAPAMMSVFNSLRSRAL